MLALNTAENHTCPLLPGLVLQEPGALSMGHGPKVRGRTYLRNAAPEFVVGHLAASNAPPSLAKACSADVSALTLTHPRFRWHRCTAKQKPPHHFSSKPDVRWRACLQTIGSIHEKWVTALRRAFE